MKTIKEGFLRKNLGLGREALIKKWLDEHKIKNYVVNDDLTIDVNGYVGLSGYTDKELPDYIRFRKVTGIFDCCDCNNLTSLEGSPKEVWDFYCSRCKNLKSLEGCPQKVHGSFDCSGCSKLESLKGCPKVVGRDFFCGGCENLKSLENCP